MPCYIYATLFDAAASSPGSAIRLWVYATTPAPLKIPDDAGTHDAVGVVLRMVREVGSVQSLFKANKWTGCSAGYSMSRLSSCCCGICAISSSPSGDGRSGAAVRHATPGCHGRGPRRAVGAAYAGAAHPATSARRPTISMLALLIAIGVSGLMIEIRRPHRHRRREGILPRPDLFRLAAAARGSRPAGPSVARRVADDRFPVFQAAACARRCSSARRATRPTMRASAATRPARAARAAGANAPRAARGQG